MQRQLALQRLQEQEREMQARLEQQKNLTYMRQMQAFGYPQVSPQSNQQFFSLARKLKNFTLIISFQTSPHVCLFLKLSDENICLSHF